MNNRVAVLVLGCTANADGLAVLSVTSRLTVFSGFAVLSVFTRIAFSSFLYGYLTTVGEMNNRVAVIVLGCTADADRLAILSVTSILAVASGLSILAVASVLAVLAVASGLSILTVASGLSILAVTSGLSILAVTSGFAVLSILTRIAFSSFLYSHLTTVGEMNNRVAVIVLGCTTDADGLSVFSILSVFTRISFCSFLYSHLTTVGEMNNRVTFAVRFCTADADGLAVLSVTSGLTVFADNISYIHRGRSIRFRIIYINRQMARFRINRYVMNGFSGFAVLSVLTRIAFSSFLYGHLTTVGEMNNRVAFAVRFCTADADGLTVLSVMSGLTRISFGAFLYGYLTTVGEMNNCVTFAVRFCTADADGLAILSVFAVFADNISYIHRSRSIRFRIIYINRQMARFRINRYVMNGFSVFSVTSGLPRISFGALLYGHLLTVGEMNNRVAVIVLGCTADADGLSVFSILPGLTRISFSSFLYGHFTTVGELNNRVAVIVLGCTADADRLTVLSGFPRIAFGSFLYGHLLAVGEMNNRVAVIVLGCAADADRLSVLSGLPRISFGAFLYGHLLTVGEMNNRVAVIVLGCTADADGLAVFSVTSGLTVFADNISYIHRGRSIRFRIIYINHQMARFRINRYVMNRFSVFSVLSGLTRISFGAFLYGHLLTVGEMI